MNRISGSNGPHTKKWTKTTFKHYSVKMKRHHLGFLWSHHNFMLLGRIISSNCTKMHICAQFGPLNKVKFFSSSSLSSIFFNNKNNNFFQFCNKVQITLWFFPPFSLLPSNTDQFCRIMRILLNGPCLWFLLFIYLFVCLFGQECVENLCFSILYFILLFYFRCDVMS